MYKLGLLVLLCIIYVSASPCPDVQECFKPKKLDRAMMCSSHKNCGVGYFCCPHGCYKHNVCVGGQPKKETDDGGNVGKLAEGFCPLPTCSRISEDLQFKCYADNDCPKDYICCPGQCYTHDICVKALLEPPIVDVLPKRIALLDVTESPDVEDQTCPPKGTCKQKYHSDDTKHLMCYGNDNCKPHELCCPDCRYGHNICTAVSIKLMEYPNITEVDDNYCIIENKKCALIPYKQSKYMECSHNDDCPEYFSCCPDTCYTHKICKKQAEYVPPDYSMCPTKEDCDVPVSTKLSKLFKCNKNVKCALGESCCPSKCFGHNVCKKTEENYVYSSCPKPPEKCNYPFSMSRMMELRCDSDSNCQKDNMCCFDVCAKFKICKSRYNVEAINKALTEGLLDLDDINLDAIR